MTQASPGFLGAALEGVERGRVPDGLTRFGIRRLCAERLRQERAGPPAARRARQERFEDALLRSPIAPAPEAAKEQHYELPPPFFQKVLGPHLKYSACYWPPGVRTLGEAEAASLAQVCARAGLADGMEVMDLGCGWGSLTLWAAARFPRARFTAVSHAPAQRRFIEEAARARGLSNVRVLTADMNEFVPDRRFDRVVSIEMFEHMHNAPRLMDRIADALRPGGRLFVHVFCHRDLAYAFETEGETNWMGRHFFTGGIMPSATLLPRLQQRLAPVARWEMNGGHYRRTANAWLRRLDTRRTRIRPILEEVYGVEEAERWLHRWRVFFMAVAEMFGGRGGREWGIVHHLLG